MNDTNVKVGTHADAVNKIAHGAKPSSIHRFQISRNSSVVLSSRAPLRREVAIDTTEPITSGFNRVLNRTVA